MPCLEKDARIHSSSKTPTPTQPRRTNTIGAVARIRNALAFATHMFFQGRGFYYVHTPIITASDCEGAGEMFAVREGSRCHLFYPPP
jgi:asparaginyl-tRNA synthetase